jgi:hypothetical protein
LINALAWVVETEAAGAARGVDRRVLAHQIAKGLKIAE